MDPALHLDRFRGGIRDGHTSRACAAASTIAAEVVSGLLMSLQIDGAIQRAVAVHTQSSIQVNADVHLGDGHTCNRDCGDVDWITHTSARRDGESLLELARCID